MWRFLNAVVARTPSESPYFAVQRRHEAGTVFTLCRALFEYLIANDASVAIVTQTYSERQKRNRAFAAEFIAPAQRLRESINTKIVTEEDIQDLALSFGTSDFVIRHQIQNHRLARISKWMSTELVDN
jgi:Zn-dependent peptidase ImmA (M78 family)